ncbi:hypothetical protein Trydic_g23034 [Trypoxylus dichotomus]
MADEVEARENLSKSDNVSQLVEMVQKLMEQNMTLVSQIMMNNNATPTNATNVTCTKEAKQSCGNEKLSLCKALS